jgi:uncharacterized membrane protein
MKRLLKQIPYKPLILAGGIILLVIWISFTPEGMLGKADAIGYAVCHRIAVRSFFFGERQIPLCARCTGQYLGAAIGLFYFFYKRPRRIGRPNWWIIGSLIIFAGFYILDGINSYIHLIPLLSRFYLYNPTNPLRLFSGTGLGLGISVLLYPAFCETIWEKRSSTPILEGFKDYLVLLLFAGFINLLVLIQNPLILYPLALLSTIGIIQLLTMVYTMVIILVFRKENQFENIKQLAYPLFAGFTLAMTQIALLDFIRFLLTGTWNGFHFG